MTEFFQEAWNNLFQSSWIDLGALISGVFYVVLAARENIWCWLFGLVNVTLFFFITFNATFYSDAGLQVVYFGLTLYGWHQWVSGKNKEKPPLQITKTSLQLWAKLIPITALFVLILYPFLDHFTDTDVAFWDALTTALSLTATWMTARKKLENWLVWIMVDPIYVVLLYYKGYPLSSLLFGIYTVIAVVGYFKWKQNLANLRNMRSY